jgi:hypothetical protein
MNQPQMVADKIKWLLRAIKQPPLQECPLQAVGSGNNLKQPAFINGWRSQHLFFKRVKGRECQCIQTNQEGGAE